jgi:hypothetical protein
MPLIPSACPELVSGYKRRGREDFSIIRHPTHPQGIYSARLSDCRMRFGEKLSEGSITPILHLPPSRGKELKGKNEIPDY